MKIELKNVSITITPMYLYSVPFKADIFTDGIKIGRAFYDASRGLTTIAPNEEISLFKKVEEYCLALPAKYDRELDSDCPQSLVVIVDDIIADMVKKAVSKKKPKNYIKISFLNSK